MPDATSATPHVPGRFGIYGGRYVPETLIAPLQEVEAGFEAIRQDAAFWQEYHQELHEYVGRPTPLYPAKRLTAHAKGAQIFLKREDLAHTGAHKINNTIGQVMLAQRLGKKKLIAETGAGMHGVATATCAARFNLGCEVFMGAKDIERQAPNVARMRMLGAQVTSVHTGSASLKDAMNEALRNWVARVDDTYYVIGSVAGPHPYPTMVREFQRVIGEETKQQLQEAVGSLPDMLIACVGGGSNAIGLFAPFLDNPQVRMRGIEAGGEGVDSGRHAAPIQAGQVGVLHGSMSYVLQDNGGQIKEAHSLSAGLDYPGVGPEHSWLSDTKRVQYHTVDDQQALAATQLLCRLEGILPALESAHAVADALETASKMSPKQRVVVNLSGRGDKDLQTLMQHLQENS